jgi:ribulose-bisphosphate carboxylase small chain
MFGLPMFDVKDAVGILGEIRKAREQHPNEYIKVIAYDARLGRQTTALSFIVNRPKAEPGFRLERTTDKDRQIKYRLHPYSADKPEGERY